MHTQVVIVSRNKLVPRSDSGSGLSSLLVAKNVNLATIQRLMGHTPDRSRENKLNPKIATVGLAGDQS